MEISLDLVQTMALAVVVLFFGRLLVRKISFLNKFCIPPPVIGGIIFAILNLIGHTSGAYSFYLNTTLQNFFMIFFFTTIGFTASIKILKKGGPAVVLFLVCATVLIFLQNVVGVSLAFAFKLNPLIGLATGSVPMTGGHGTSAAFTPLFEEKGAFGAHTVAISAATFGLIMGSMIGGPIGRFLTLKNNLIEKQKSKGTQEYTALEESSETLKSSNVVSAFLLVSITMGIGSIVTAFLNEGPLALPAYVGSMIVAVIIRNISDATGGKIPVHMPEIETLGGLFLGIFLSYALMTLKLWELADLAGPFLVMLVAQVLLLALFVLFVTFRVMGKDYDAAAISAGHCGFGLGATPNAMANMRAFTEKYLPSPKAFFVVPIVGGMFIDFTNAIIITAFMNMFS